MQSSFQDQDYTLDSHNRITSPGKFEGELNYVPYLWDAVLNGFGTIVDGEGDNVTTRLELTPDDKLHWPNLYGDFADLWEDSQGFVHCQTFLRGDEPRYDG